MEITWSVEMKSRGFGSGPVWLLCWCLGLCALIVSIVCFDCVITQPLKTFNKSEMCTHKSKENNWLSPYTCRVPRYIYRIESSPLPITFYDKLIKHELRTLGFVCYEIWPLWEHLAGTWKVLKKDLGRTTGGHCSHPITCHAHVRIIYTQYFLFLRSYSRLSILAIETIDFYPNLRLKEHSTIWRSVPSWILKKRVEQSTPIFCSTLLD